MSIQDKELFPINFIDLKAQQAVIRDKVEDVVLQVLDHGKYIAGPEVAKLESELSQFCQAKYALTCANGTDALTIALLAKNIGPGDAVFVPSYTFAASAEVVAALGATPVFVDVCNISFNMDLNSLKDAIALSKNNKLYPKAIVAVDLFGLPADYEGINAIARDNDLWVLSDSAQSFGATINNQKVGTFGLATTTSFFPAKPLGCYGDGGCIFTDDADLAEVMLSLKSHGQGKTRNDYTRIGMNSRLDSMQAGILLEKLKIFPEELQHRDLVARTYSELLSKDIKTPFVKDGYTSAWAQYTIILPKNKNRDKIASDLKDKQVPTAIYYAKPLHMQEAYKEFSAVSPALTNTEYLSKHVISLPMDGYISMNKIDYITNTINNMID